MPLIEVEKEDDKIVLYCFANTYKEAAISMSISEAKKLSSDLHKALIDEWVKPDVKLLDAKQIIADLDSRQKVRRQNTRSDYPKPKSRKRTLQDDIEGI